MQRANRMRKDFIANASHELRTPLTVISGYLEAIDNETDQLSTGWQARIKQMRNQARRMQNLIEDLLKLSRLESNPSAGLDNEVDIAELISVIHEEAQTLSGNQNHVINVEIQAGLIAQRGPGQSLQRVFQYRFQCGAIHACGRRNRAEMASARNGRLPGSDRYRRRDPG